MPKITVLPHPEICPEGAEFDDALGRLRRRRAARPSRRHRARMRQGGCVHHLPLHHPEGLQLAAGALRHRGRSARPRLGPDVGVAIVMPGDRAGRGPHGRDPASTASTTRRRANDHAGPQVDGRAGHRDRTRGEVSARWIRPPCASPTCTTGSWNSTASPTIRSVPAKRSSRRSSRRGLPSASSVRHGCAQSFRPSAISGSNTHSISRRRSCITSASSCMPAVRACARPYAITCGSARRTVIR